jgi:hypothetical protein
MLRQKIKTRNLKKFDARFKVFTAVKIQVKVFWVVMPHSVAVGYHHFGGSCWYPPTTLHSVTTQKTSIKSNLSHSLLLAFPPCQI